MKKKILLLILAITMLFPVKVVLADTIQCDERGNWKDFSVKLHDQKNNSYAKGERVYLDIRNLPPFPESKLTGFVLLQKVKNSTDDISTYARTAYFKDIFGPNSLGLTYFIIPDYIEDGEYDIVRYGLFYQSDEQIGTYGTIDGSTGGILYKKYCEYYALDENTRIDSNDLLMKVDENVKTIKVSSNQEVRKCKSELNSISAVKDYSYIDGTIDFKVSLTAPAKKIMVMLYNDNNDKIMETLDNVDNKSTEFIGSIKVPSYIPTGNYELKSVIITDDEERSIQYLEKVPDEGSPKYGVLKSYVKVKIGDSISTITGADDFKVEKFELKKDNAVIGEKVNIDFRINNNPSYEIGLKSVLVSFYNESTNEMFSAFLKDDYKSIIIPTSAKEGTYKIQSINLELESYVGETKSIIISRSKHDAEYDSIFEEELTVGKPKSEDVLYFNLANLDDEAMFKIKESKEDAIIMLDASRQSIVDSEIFDVIKESQRQLIIEHGKNQWVFNGTDIVEPKTIDVSMKFYEVKDSELDEKLAAVIGSDSLVVEFPENGELPGTALIRIYDDGIYEILRNDKYYVYHIDDDNNKVNKVSMEVQKSEGGYIEFYINHNSKYVITAEEIKDDSVVGDDDSSLKYNEREKQLVEGTPKNSNITTYLLIGIGIAIVILVFLIGVLSGMSKKSDTPKKSNKKSKTKESEEDKEE